MFSGLYDPESRPPVLSGYHAAEPPHISLTASLAGHLHADKEIQYSMHDVKAWSHKRETPGVVRMEAVPNLVRPLCGVSGVEAPDATSACMRM